MEQSKEELFKAFEAGNIRVNNEQPKASVRQRFEEWYSKQPVYMAIKPKENMIIYQHEIRCRAHETSPIGGNMCSCLELLGGTTKQHTVNSASLLDDEFGTKQFGNIPEVRAR